MDLENVVIERRRVKYARILISPDCKISLVIPQNFTEKNIEFLMRSKEEWIRKTLAKFEKNKKYYFSLEPHQMLYLGEIYTFEKNPVLENSVRILPADKKIVSGVNLLAKPVQEQFYKIQADTLIKPRAAELASQHRLNYKKIFIRSQKTKWGTCSSLGNLSFNWRLVKAPPPVIDYVILHELAHTLHMNHSKEYWDALGNVCPDYKVHRDWLKKYGRNL